MLRGEDLGPGPASVHPHLPDLMCPLPPHMAWMGLGTAIVAHYIKLLLISGKSIVEGAPYPCNIFLRKISQWGCQLHISLYKVAIVVGKPQE